MTTLAPGAHVLIGYPKSDIPAVILAVQIFRDGSHNYHVEWWDGRNRNDEWILPESLVAGPREPSLKIETVD